MYFQGVAKNTKELKINWKYCECGCKGSEATVAGQTYSIYDTLRGPYYLAIGRHHARLNGKEYPNRETVQAAILEDIKSRLPKIKAMVAEQKQILKAFGE